jgi:hypothetical protein
MNGKFLQHRDSQYEQAPPPAYRVIVDTEIVQNVLGQKCPQDE